MCKQKIALHKLFTVCKQMRYDLFKNKVTNKLFTYKLYIYTHTHVHTHTRSHTHLHMYVCVCVCIKKKLAFNNYQELACH